MITYFPHLDKLGMTLVFASCKEDTRSIKAYQRDPSQVDGRFPGQGHTSMDEIARVYSIQRGQYLRKVILCVKYW